MRTIRNATVAVVGGAGFLGSHLVNHLIEDRECEVLVIDNLCVGRREFIHPKADFEYADITKSGEAHLRHLFKGIEFVFNYAAWPYIPDSFARPAHVFEVNANGAISVINAAQEAGCTATLQVSSAEIYGDGTMVRTNEGMYGEQDKIDESTRVTPHSTYGVAKAAVDSYVQCAWRERKTPAIALRQFNCVGERETHPYVIPEIISQLAAQQCGGSTWEHTVNQGLGSSTRDENVASVRLGNNSFRDFLYAGDQAKIAVELLERGQFGEVYNLGSETGIKMYDLAKLIGKVMGFADVQVVEDESRKRPWEIWSLLSSNGKIYSVVGRRELSTLEDSLKRTVDWYEKNGRKWPWEMATWLIAFLTR